MASESDFEFILTIVHGQKADSPIHKSLSRFGIDGVEGITSLAVRRIKNLKYKDGTSETAVLTEFSQSCLRATNNFYFGCERYVFGGGSGGIQAQYRLER